MTRQIFDGYSEKLVSATLCSRRRAVCGSTSDFLTFSCCNAADLLAPDHMSMSFPDDSSAHDFESTLFVSRQESLPAKFCMGLIELDDQLNK